MHTFITVNIRVDLPPADKAALKRAADQWAGVLARAFEAEITRIEVNARQGTTDVRGYLPLLVTPEGGAACAG